MEVNLDGCDEECEVSKERFSEDVILNFYIDSVPYAYRSIVYYPTELKPGNFSNNFVGFDDVKFFNFESREELFKHFIFVQEKPSEYKIRKYIKASKEEFKSFYTKLTVDRRVKKGFELPNVEEILKRFSKDLTKEAESVVIKTDETSFVEFELSQKIEPKVIYSIGIDEEIEITPGVMKKNVFEIITAVKVNYVKVRVIDLINVQNDKYSQSFYTAPAKVIREVFEKYQLK